MEDCTTEDMMKVSGESTEVNSNEFLLTFYDTTEPFDYGSEKEAVLEYIKGSKGGRGGSFKMVMKGGKRKPFLGKTFEKKENIIGYEFVPEEVASPQLGK
jgi:hypothetical protein